MVLVAQECDLEFDVERGPDWLFVRPHRTSLRGHEMDLADSVWHLLEQSMTHRLVLELDDVGPLYSSVIGQMVLLYKRIHEAGGLMRICGLSSANQRVLATCRLGGHFPQFTDRTDAVMGHRPCQPR